MLFESAPVMDWHLKNRPGICDSMAQFPNLTHPQTSKSNSYFLILKLVIKPYQCRNSGRIEHSDFCRQCWQRWARTLRDRVLQSTCVTMMLVLALHPPPTNSAARAALSFSKAFCWLSSASITSPVSKSDCVVLSCCLSSPWCCGAFWAAPTVLAPLLLQFATPAADDDMARSILGIFFVFNQLSFLCFVFLKFSLLFSAPPCPWCENVLCSVYQLAYSPSTWWKCGNQRLRGRSVSVKKKTADVKYFEAAEIN